MNENIMNALNAIDDELAGATADVMIAMESYTDKANEFNETSDNEVVMEAKYDFDFKKKFGDFYIVKHEDVKGAKGVAVGDECIAYFDPRMDDDDKNDLGLSKGIIIYGPEHRKNSDGGFECAVLSQNGASIKEMKLTELFPHIKSKYGLNRNDERDFRAAVAYARTKANSNKPEKSDQSQDKSN